MPNLREKTWTPTTPAQTADAQFWEDHLIDDASYEGLQEILEGGGGGHIIENPSGTEMPQQPVLQFINATVTNGEGKTIVSGNGEKGDAATVAVGTVATGAPGTNAQVTNSGTQYDAVLDFVIPRGADGIPLGGTAGQTIVKQSSADRNAIWSNLDASNVNLGTGTVETLAGSIATIETSPATANHSVGEYIVYNGQLYIATTAITAGNTLAGKISATSMADALNRIGADNKIRIFSVATDNSTNGFRIMYSSSSTFRMLYFDGTRIAMITKETNQIPSLVEAVGTFASKSCESENTYLRVSAWTRAVFIVTSGTLSRLNEMSIQTY